MKELRRLQGGYKRGTDYHLNTETEMLSATNGILKKLEIDLVLSGCEVTDNGNGTVNIAAGLVYISGEILRFDAANNIVSDGTKALVKGAYVTSTPIEFADQQTRDIYKEAKAIIGDYSTPSQIKVTLQLTNLRTYIIDLVASAAFKGERRSIIDLDGTFLSHFDASGLGVLSPYIGWALPNGNNGLPNYSGRVAVTAGTYTDPVTGLQTVYSAGSTGGEIKHKLTVAELPNFRMTYKGWGTYQGNKNGDNNGPDHDNQDFKWITMQTDPIGGDQAHNIMQPYINEYTIVKLY